MPIVAVLRESLNIVCADGRASLFPQLSIVPDDQRALWECLDRNDWVMEYHTAAERLCAYRRVDWDMDSSVYVAYIERTRTCPS